MEINAIDVVNGYLTVCYFDGALMYDENYNVAASLNMYTFGTPYPHAVAHREGRYYIADGFHGLVDFGNIGDNRKLSIVGPPKNMYYRMEPNLL